MSQSHYLYRCQADGKLLRERDIAAGVCALPGHHIKFATNGTFLEWLKIQWWKLTGGL